MHTPEAAVTRHMSSELFFSFCLIALKLSNTLKFVTKHTRVTQTVDYVCEGKLLGCSFSCFLA